MRTCPSVHVDSIGEPLFPLPGLLRRVTLLVMLFCPCFPLAVAAVLIGCSSWPILEVRLVSVLAWRRVCFALGFTPNRTCSAALPKAAKLDSLTRAFFVLTNGVRD